MKKLKKNIRWASYITKEKSQVLSELDLTGEDFQTLYELIKKEIKIDSMKTILWAITKIFVYTFIMYKLTIFQFDLTNIVDFLLLLFQVFVFLIIFFRLIREILSSIWLKETIKNKELINENFVEIFVKKIDYYEIKKNLSNQKRKVNLNLLNIITANTMPDEYIVGTLKLYKEKGECFDLDKFNLESLSVDKARTIINQLSDYKRLNKFRELIIIIEKELKILGD